MRELIKNIEASGQLDAFWKSIAKTNSKNMRGIQKLAQGRQKLEAGSTWISDDEEKFTDSESSEHSEWSVETPTGEESSSFIESAGFDLEESCASPGIASNKESGSPHKFKRSARTSLTFGAIPFNPLRFIAEHL